MRYLLQHDPVDICAMTHELVCYDIIECDKYRSEMRICVMCCSPSTKSRRYSSRGTRELIPPPGKHLRVCVCVCVRVCVIDVACITP